MFLGKDVHIQCWVFSKGLYGKLGWGFVRRSDTCFNVRIRDNKIRVMRSKKGEEVFEIDDLKQTFPL
jgi:hypothetical protein